MRKKRGLLSLFDDCSYYQNSNNKEMEVVHKYKNPGQEEIVISKPKVNGLKPKTETNNIQSDHYDNNEAINLSLTYSDYGDPNVQRYAQGSSQNSMFTDGLDYYVEPFENAGKENGKALQDVLLNDEKPRIHNKKEPSSEDVIIINNPNPKSPSVMPEPSQRIPVMPGAVLKETLPMDDDAAFAEDIKAILTGKKRYDPSHKKVISEPTEDGPKRAKRPKALIEEEKEEKKNEHAIFDKIAQSMQLATSYDLGSINLDQKFDAFDKEISKKETFIKKKTALTDPISKKIPMANLSSETPKENITITEKEIEIKPQVDTADFLKDLDKITETMSLSGAFSNDVPLSPKTGGMSISKDALEIGDIILSTTNDASISGTIRKITRSEISHAAVYVGKESVIEAVDAGVLERSIDTAMLDDTVTVAFRHQNMTADKAKVIKDYLTEKRKVGTKFDQYAVVRNLPIQIITSACSMLSSGLRDKCRNFAGRIFLGTETNNEFYCSELVFAAFQSAGLQLTNTDPQWTSPEDLVQLSYNGALRYVGHLKATKF